MSSPKNGAVLEERSPMDNASMTRYAFKLLRYVPNIVSAEFFNIGVFLYSADGGIVEARFAPDFRRLRCNPLVELDYLDALRDEFEEQRLRGRDFPQYVDRLRENLSTCLEISSEKTFWGTDAATEIERLCRTYLVTASGEEIRGERREPRAGTRRALRRRMDEAFRHHHLIGNGGGLKRDIGVNYGSARLRFTFDYSYQPNGVVNYVHGLALRNDINDASKLCFVFERLRGLREQPIKLTAVVDDEVPDDAFALLRESHITTREASKLDRLAVEIRQELGVS